MHDGNSVVTIGHASTGAVSVGTALFLLPKTLQRRHIMKKTFKSLLVALLVLLAVAALTLVACDQTPDDAPHQHTFSSRWSSNDVEHWHAATCGHDETADLAAHDYGTDNVCDTCGYTKAPSGSDDPGSQGGGGSQGDDPAPNTVTVTFAINYSGGTNPSARTVAQGSSVILPGASRTGYAFDGWYTESSGGTLVGKEGASYVAKASVTLYAHWTVDQQGGGQGDAPTPHQHVYSQLWSTNSTEHWHAAICGHNVTSDRAAHDYGTDNVCDTCGYTRGQTATSVLEVQNAQIEGPNIFMLVEPTVSYVPLAQVVKVSDGYIWTLSYDIIGSDIINSKVATQKDGQLDNGNNTFYIVVSSQNDPSIIFVYTITIHRSYLTQISYHFKNSVVNTQQFYTGNVIQAEWTPNFTGYTFNCWRDGEEQQYLTQTLWESLDLYADATANSYNVTLDVNDGNSLDQTQYSVSYDSKFTLPTPTREGHTFLGWYNGADKITDGTNTNIEAWNITDNVRLQAHWQINAYTLGVEVSGATHGSVKGGGTFTYGNSVTLTATTNMGYIFLGWYEGERLVSDELVYTFDMPAKSINYTATWKEDEPLSSLEFTSTPTTCTITGVKDSAVTNIVVPSYVTSIGSGAFRRCNSLESITLPFVGEKADGTGATHFGYIFGANSYSDNRYDVPTSLKKVVITGGAIIDEHAFYDCRNLMEITIPSTVTSIGNYAFGECFNLQTVTFEGNSQLQSIGNWAFDFCSQLTSITIPSTVTSIGRSAFYDCSQLTSITISSMVTSIGEYAFGGCSNLQTVTFESDSQLQSIGYRAFNYCSQLTSITIPSTVTSIGEYAFDSCGLQNVYYGGTIEDWCGIEFKDGSANPMCYATKFYMKKNDDWQKITEIEIPKCVEKINDYQFYGFNNITSILIPSTVTSIGKSAFECCSSLESITLPFVGAKSDGTGSISFWYIFGDVPTSLKKVVITGGASIDESAFYKCSSLTEITIPSTVTSIGDWAFASCSNLQTVTFEGDSQLQSIGEHAFYGCSSLQEITIPENVKSIGKCAFQKCIDLVTVDWNANNCMSVGRNYDQGNYTTFFGCTSLATINIGANVTSIPASVFLFCDNLQNVYYGGTIEDWCGLEFGDYWSNPMRYADHFYMKQGGDWQEVTKIEIPESVAKIGDYQFDGFGNVTSITIPSTVTSIGEYAFCGCSKLTSITIPSKVTSIGGAAFADCSQLKSITIPSKVTSIGNSAFSGCSALQTVTFEGNSHLQSIGNWAFEYCSQLKSITIPSTVTSIGGYAFRDCSQLTIYCEAASKPLGWDESWNPGNRPVEWGYKKQ